MTLTELKRIYAKILDPLYGDRESKNFLQWVLEHFHISIHDTESLAPNAQAQCLEVLDRLQQWEPIQYILSKAYFFEYELTVTPDVLIPRPETEELVEWILHDLGAEEHQSAKSIMDIGTGSGCIPIILKLKMPHLRICALDISEPALVVARQNAQRHGAEIEWRLSNVLEDDLFDFQNSLDILVSNPPYVDQREKSLMGQNVLDYEPEIALFTGEEDSLLFYRRIAILAKIILRPNGLVYLEMNALRSAEIEQLFQENGYHTDVRSDLSGKERMLKLKLRS